MGGKSGIASESEVILFSDSLLLRLIFIFMLPLRGGSEGGAIGVPDLAGVALGDEAVTGGLLPAELLIGDEGSGVWTRLGCALLSSVTEVAVAGSYSIGIILLRTTSGFDSFSFRGISAGVGKLAGRIKSFPSEFLGKLKVTRAGLEPEVLLGLPSFCLPAIGAVPDGPAVGDAGDLPALGW